MSILLPGKVYQQVEKLSQVERRSVADEVVAGVTAVLPEPEALPEVLQAELSQLDQFSDEELWQAARMITPVEKTERMQLLVEKQQMEGLTAVEQEEAALLSQFFNRIMLVRAKAVVLLQARGLDISSLLDNTN